ncbi:MAG: RNA polymerase sigma factor [bacterium]
MSEQLDDLLHRTAQGDQQAFQQLYQATSTKLFGLCLQMLKGDHASAEDVLQEGFIKIWHNAERFSSEKGHAFSWMSTIIVNQARDALRVPKKRAILTQASEQETLEYASQDQQPEAVQEQIQQLYEVQQQLSQLSSEQQDCIVQSYYYGYSHTEITERTAQPLGTVKSWINRGIQKLRVELPDYRVV